MVARVNFGAGIQQQIGYACVRGVPRSHVKGCLRVLAMPLVHVGAGQKSTHYFVQTE